MSYEIVLGSLGPIFPLALTENNLPFVLDTVNDTVILRYLDPTGATHQVVMTITLAASGQVQHVWINGELPAVGVYKGQVTVTRAGDTSFPRIFPSDGSKVIWWVHKAI